MAARAQSGLSLGRLVVTAFGQAICVVNNGSNRAFIRETQNVVSWHRFRRKSFRFNNLRPPSWHPDEMRQMAHLARECAPYVCRMRAGCARLTRLVSLLCYSCAPIAPSCAPNARSATLKIGVCIAIRRTWRGHRRFPPTFRVSNRLACTNDFVH